MAIPIIKTIAESYSAAASFTTALAYHNWDSGAFQVIWSGVNSDTGTVKLRGSQDKTNWTDLDSDVVTMVVSSGNQLWNLWHVGYQYVQAYYAAGSNTGGSITIYATAKSRQ